MSKKFLFVSLALFVSAGVVAGVFFISIRRASSRGAVPTPLFSESVLNESFPQSTQHEDTSSIPEGCTLSPYPLTGGYTPSDFVLDVRGGLVCRFTIHPQLPPYIFYLIGNPARNIIDRIEVVSSRENATRQTLAVGADILPESPPRGAPFFSVRDVNFDGYADMQMIVWWGATGNTGYAYWLFDSSNGTFVYNNDLSTLSNPTPHPETQTITTHSVGGMVGMIYQDRTYAFDDGGALVLIREEKQDWVSSSLPCRSR